MLVAQFAIEVFGAHLIVMLSVVAWMKHQHVRFNSIGLCQQGDVL